MHLDTYSSHAGEARLGLTVKAVKIAALNTQPQKVRPNSSNRKRKTYNSLIFFGGPPSPSNIRLLSHLLLSLTHFPLKFHLFLSASFRGSQHRSSRPHCSLCPWSTKPCSTSFRTFLAHAEYLVTVKSVPSTTADWILHSASQRAALAHLGERQTEVNFRIIYLEALCSIHRSRNICDSGSTPSIRTIFLHFSSLNGGDASHAICDEWGRQEIQVQFPPNVFLHYVCAT